jgi:hypothetical protein
LGKMSEAEAKTPPEAKKGEESAPAADPAPSETKESRGPRRGPRGGEKTCYNCGQVRQFSVLNDMLNRLLLIRDFSLF